MMPLWIDRRQETAFLQYRLDPSETRALFLERGWRRVVAFQTRNPVHRAHEYIQKCALEIADGLLLHPLVGETKADDIPAAVRIQSYETILKHYYPAARTVLAVLPAAMRYAGPREAVFTALCSKNMGCSHFIIGRDHTGVGNFYSRHANRELFDSLGDMGVKPVFFETVGYNRETDKYEVDRGQPLTMISGTEVRETLRADKYLPDWFMRDLVQEVLLAEIRSGKSMFYE